MVTQPIAKDRENGLKTKLAESIFLDSNEYHTFNNVSIPAGFRTIQIDHVIVSRFGIFVVETKNKNGWIFGSRSDRHWTQMISGKKYKFQNPLRKNFLHTQSLAKLVGISSDMLHSVIVFWGNCEFRTIMPYNVLNNKLTGFIKSKKKEILTDEEVGNICALLSRIKKTTLSQDWRNQTKMYIKRFGKN